jgi:hypothetical protein
LAFFKLTWVDNGILFPMNAGAITALARFDFTKVMVQQVIPRVFDASATSDSRRVVYVDPSTRNLVSAQGDGRNVVELVPAARTGMPIVTADDRSVVFISAASGVASPWIVPIAGGTPLQIAKTFVGVTNIDVFMDANTGVFTTRETSDQLVTIICGLPSCASPVRLPALGQPRWMPRGRNIAYLSEPRTNIWTQPRDGSKPRQLTQLKEDSPIVDFRWSRDGKRLAIARSIVTNDIVLFRGLKK